MNKYLKILLANLLVFLIGGILFSGLYILFSLIIYGHVKVW